MILCSLSFQCSSSCPYSAHVDMLFLSICFYADITIVSSRPIATFSRIYLEDRNCCIYADFYVKN